MSIYFSRILHTLSMTRQICAVCSDGCAERDRQSAGVRAALLKTARLRQRPIAGTQYDKAPSLLFLSGGALIKSGLSMGLFAVLQLQIITKNLV